MAQPRHDKPGRLLDSHGRLVTEGFDSAFREKDRTEVLINKDSLEGLVDVKGDRWPPDDMNPVSRLPWPVQMQRKEVKSYFI